MEIAIAGSVTERLAGKPPPHIALVVAGMGAGGAERVISILARHWIEKGCAVTIIAFDRPDAPIFHPLEQRVRTVRLGLAAQGGPMRWSAVLRRYTALRRTLDQLRPDVTISFLTKINVLSLLACLGSERRLIISERNNPMLQQAHPLWTKLLRRLHWRASAIVMQTRKSRECLDETARERARVIANPIEIKLLPHAIGATRCLAAAGRLTWQKGFDMLIDAFAEIADRHPDWMLVIWGEGEAREALEHQVARHGLETRIHLPGNSRSPAEWIRKSDAFVFSSRYEGFGNALGEAMAAGLPVVSFDCDYGPREMIRDGDNGILVPPNDIGGLAEALDRLLRDPDLRTRLGDAARSIADRYRPSAITALWDELLAELDIL